MILRPFLGDERDEGGKEGEGSDGGIYWGGDELKRDGWDKWDEGGKGYEEDKGGEGDRGGERDEGDEGELERKF